LGKALVGEMMGLFDYERYHDEYREALEKLISAKLEGRQVSVEATTPITQDLTDALLKSIAQRKGG
jgi:non-homologous end joining protein Ku